MSIFVRINCELLENWFVLAIGIIFFWWLLCPKASWFQIIRFIHRDWLVYRISVSSQDWLLMRCTQCLYESIFHYDLSWTWFIYQFCSKGLDCISRNLASFFLCIASAWLVICTINLFLFLKWTNVSFAFIFSHYLLLP